MAGLSCGVTVKKNHNRHKKQDLRKIEDEKYTIIHVPFYLISLCLRGLRGKKKSLRKPQRRMGQRIFRETAKQTYLCFEICLTN